MRVRWCSAYAKIDVLDLAINNQERFHHSHALVITGEWAEESPSRAKYSTFERHRCDRRDSPKLLRWIDHWRPVHGLSREQVWAMLQHWGVQPHPAYVLGWGRLSCMRCIFGSPSQWASSMAIAPQETARMHLYEQEFEHTIDHHRSIPQMVALGNPYPSLNPQVAAIALSSNYTAPVRIPPDHWLLPAGANDEESGPT